MTDLSTKTTRELIEQARQSLRCLYIATDESVARDVSRCVSPVIDECERLTKIVAAVRRYCETFSTTNSSDSVAWGMKTMAQAVLEILNQEPTR